MLGRCRRYWMLQLGMRGPVGEMALHHTADHLFGERNVNDPALGDRVEAIRPPLDGLGRDVVADEITEQHCGSSGLAGGTQTHEPVTVCRLIGENHGSIQCRADAGEPADSPLHNAGMLSPQVVDEAREVVEVISSLGDSIWHGPREYTAMAVAVNFKYTWIVCQEVFLDSNIYLRLLRLYFVNILRTSLLCLWVEVLLQLGTRSSGEARHIDRQNRTYRFLGAP